MSSVQRVQLHHPTGNLGNLTAPALREHASRTAIIDLSSGAERLLTYEALENEIQRAVGALRALGIRRGDRAAIGLPNGATFLVTLFALMRLGAVPVVLNSKLSNQSLHFILRDSGSDALFADLIETPSLAALGDDLRIRHRMTVRGAADGWLDWSALCAEAKLCDLVERMSADEQAFQPYTAGSTGVPKGIVMTHGGLLWGIEHDQAHWPVGPHSRGIVAAPLFHKNAMRGTVKRMLRGGASIVIQKRFRAREYLTALDKYRVTSCGGVPTMFAELLREPDLLAAGDYTSLKYLSMGSSVVPVELLARVAEVFPNATIAESYGLTEGGGPFGSPPDGRKVPRGSVGALAPEMEVRLVDPAGNDAASGELWIRSPYVMAGYANNPQLTRERLQDGWLRTRDVFRVDAAGFYYFVGRTDDMFVCGGENIYPKEVEQLVLSHPAVSDVIVVPLPHDTKGYAPAALIQLRAGHQLDATEIQSYCAANGPAYAIPRAILFAQELPQTTAGKPDRQAALDVLRLRFGSLKSRGIAAPP